MHWYDLKTTFKKCRGRLITATRNNTDNTNINRTKITNKNGKKNKSICISQSQRILCITFSETDSGLCIYHFFVLSNSCTIPSGSPSPSSCVYVFIVIIIIIWLLMLNFILILNIHWLTHFRNPVASCSPMASEIQSAFSALHFWPCAKLNLVNNLVLENYPKFFKVTKKTRCAYFF